MEITQTKQRGKVDPTPPTEQSKWKPWNNFQWSNTCVIGVTEGEERVGRRNVGKINGYTFSKNKDTTAQIQIQKDLNIYI